MTFDKKKHKMMNMYSKYDNMHHEHMNDASKCTNKHVITHKYCMLLHIKVLHAEPFDRTKNMVVCLLKRQELLGHPIPFHHHRTDIITYRMLH